MKVVVEVDRFFRNTRVYKPMTIRRIAAKAQQSY
jgi:hypothetical protein